MVRFSFIKCVSRLVSILYKRSVLIGERNWEMLLRRSRSTCHGGFHGESSRSPKNGLFFELMVLFSFIKRVFRLVSILCKRFILIDERNWPLLLRGSRLTCHGGFRGEFSWSPENGLFFALTVFFSFIRCVFRLVSILCKWSVSIDERNWEMLLRGSRSTCHGGFRSEFSWSPGNGLFFALTVLFSFIKRVFRLVSILCKRSVLIDERNWPFGLWGSGLACHGGFRGEFSMRAENDLFFVLLVLFLSSNVCFDL
jgi:hypothetical protein